MTTDNDDRIQRSAGKLVAASAGPAVRIGGGYRGARDDQDEAVKTLAHLLADAFPDHGVEIRYNTNRLGGGAWLKDGGRNNQVGLGADLVAPERHRQRYETFLGVLDDYENLSIRDFPSAKDRLTPGDRVLVFSVNMKPPAIDESLTNRESSFGNYDDYYHNRFDTLAEAWSFFADNVNRDGIRPPA